MGRKNLIACALLLAGCANGWVRPPGVDEAQFKHDVSACRAAAFYVPIPPESIFVGAYPSTDPTQGLSDVANRDLIEGACMESKGYKKQ